MSVSSTVSRLTSFYQSDFQFFSRFAMNFGSHLDLFCVARFKVDKFQPM